MPSLGDIKRRIKSVKNTQQITKAMKMVSAAKLRRAQDEIIAARPYAEKMLEMISRLAAEMAAEAKKKEDAAKAAKAAGSHGEETGELATDASVEDGSEGGDQGAAPEGEEAGGEETGELATDASVEDGSEGKDQGAAPEGEEAGGEETSELATDASVEDGSEGEDQGAAPEGEEAGGEETGELATDTSIEPWPEDQEAAKPRAYLSDIIVERVVLGGGKALGRILMRTAKAAKKVAEKVRGSYVGKALGRVLGRAAEVAEKGKGSYVGKKVLGIIPGGAARTSEKQHPLLSGTGGPSRPGGPKKGVVLITSDRGLCGAFNTVLLRTMEDFLAEHADSEPVLYLMGNRGIEYFNRRGFKAFSSRAVGTKRPEYSTAAEIARELIDLYLNKEVDEVYIVYSEFISALTQVPRIRRLLPITPEAAEEAVDEVAKEEAPVPPGPGEEGGQPDGEGRNGEAEVKFLYEPSTREVLADLLPKHVEVQFFSTLLESSASEHGARMTAMDAASRSASEMIDGLTLKYNRLRQAAITKELMEIISGAESLKS